MDMIQRRSCERVEPYHAKFNGNKILLTHENDSYTDVSIRSSGTNILVIFTSAQRKKWRLSPHRRTRAVLSSDEIGAGSLQSSSVAV